MIKPLETQRNIDRIRGLEDACRAFVDGRTNADDFRTARVPMGVYEERTAGQFMVRTRCPAGIVTADQLRHVAVIARTHGAARVHATSRQDLQLHGLALESVIPTLKKLLAAGLETFGSGGNTVRNVTASPLAGVDPEEPFDVTEHALLVAVATAGKASLPRKLKIAFASAEGDDVGARFNDLGFVATRVGDSIGYRVYAAGGLGARPRIGRLLADFVPTDEAVLVARAVLSVFETLGAGRAKQNARLRFIVEDVGWSRFCDLYVASREQVENVGGIAHRGEVSAAGSKPRLSIDVPRSWFRDYVSPQRQSGLHAVTVPLSAGDLNIEQLHVLATIGNSLGEDSIRLAPTQNVVLRHVPADQLSELHAQLVRAFRGVARPRVLGDLTCCAGAATCQLGICRPPGLADALEQRLARLSERELERVRGLSIRLSGCPNNCGRHVLADLGLQGKAIRHGAAHMPGYRIMVGARREEPAHLARPLGDLPVRRVPDFVAEILRRFAGSEHARFEEFVTEHEGDLRNLLAGVNSAYPLTSDDASDLGATEAFSLPETTAGECSA